MFTRSRSLLSIFATRKQNTGTQKLYSQPCERTDQVETCQATEGRLQCHVIPLNFAVPPLPRALRPHSPYFFDQTSYSIEISGFTMIEVLQIAADFRLYESLFSHFRFLLCRNDDEIVGAFFWLFSYELKLPALGHFYRLSEFHYHFCVCNWHFLRHTVIF
jgi:hypothetical protein